MSFAAVLDIIDTARAFGDPPAVTEVELKRFGNSELNAQLASVTDLERLQAAAQHLGRLTASGAIDEAYVAASLEMEAGRRGLLREHGGKIIKKTITAGLKAGKKQPRDLTEVRRAAIAALGAPHEDGRPREAGDRSISPPQVRASTTLPHTPPAPPQSGNEDERVQMDDWPEASASEGRGGSVDESARDLNMRLAFYPLTDLGNAERFRDRFRDLLRWYPAKETWLAWDGKRWSAERGAEVVKRSEHITVRAIQVEAETVRQSGRRDIPDALPGALDYLFEEKRDGTETLYSDKIARWGRSSEALNKVSALSKLASAYLSVSTEELDADKMKITSLEQRCAGRAEVAEIRELSTATFAGMVELRAALGSLANGVSASNPEDGRPLHVAPRRPPGNWKKMKDLMFIYGLTETAIRKMIKKKHATVWQPDGKGTAFEVDLDSLPAPRRV